MLNLCTIKIACNVVSTTKQPKKYDWLTVNINPSFVILCEDINI